MTEVQKLAYDATLNRLHEAFPGNHFPYVSQVAKYLNCSMYALTGDKSFKRLAHGDRHLRISLENIAVWQCRIIS